MSVMTFTGIAAYPWLRSARFDLSLIVGVLLLALGTTAVVSRFPELFVPVLVLDLWLLGYHHVIATYTRICFDRESLRQHGALLYALLPGVALLTIAVAWSVGLWVIVSIYFYWQWWHYTRQSWGISRAYRAKDKGQLYEDGWLDQAIFYALPILGILHRSHQNHPTFIGLELWSLPVPGWLVQIAAAATALLLTIWLIRRVLAAWEGRLARVHTLYMLTHFTIFAVGYIIVPDNTLGWLAINIWHNAQYILFVWMYNTRRFKDGVNPNARILSYISQPHRLWLYLLTCVAITGVLYWGVLRTIDWLFFAGLSATIVLYQIVNFHHYIVDSMIWKVRKPEVRQNIGL